MKYLLLLIVWPVLLNCTQEKSKERPGVRQPASATTAATATNYDSCKNVIRLIRQKQKPLWAKNSLSAKEKIFTSAVTETIIPAWIGTSWNFNGTSEAPQQGSIACGYFVTTVLRDAGVPLARVKLAQCASEQMIMSLVQAKYIRRYSQVTMTKFIESVQDQGYGLYIVGLDNHTGFIYNDGNDIYFIHSTFAGTKDVQKERAAASWILDRSKYKVLGKISADEKLLAKWIS